MFKILAVSVSTVTLAAGASFALSYAHDDLRPRSAAPVPSMAQDAQDGVILLAEASGDLGFSSDFDTKDVRDRDGSDFSTGTEAGGGKGTDDVPKQGGGYGPIDTPKEPETAAPVDFSASESESVLIMPVRAPMVVAPSRVAPRLSPPIPMPAPSSRSAPINFNPVATGVLR